ncbi:MAG: ABC transporter permease [Betaproteobacteria bacterium]|nr:ABC transporter permease [Betaproteobacteria bacterium]
MGGQTARIARFIGVRLAVSAPVILGIVFLTFMLIRMGGQDPVAMLAGPMADEAMLNALRAQLQLDQPLLAQFANYMVRIAHGDLGVSWQGGIPVLNEIRHLFPATLELVLLSVALAALIGIPIGMRAATKPNGWFDQISRFVSLAGFSMPTYWMGLMAILVFFYILRWAPAPMGRLSMEVAAPAVVTGSILVDALLEGNWRAMGSALAHLALPVACFTMLAAAPMIKQTRAIVIEIMGSDYVRYARANGFSAATVRRMALRNAATPLLTFLGSELTSLLAAAALIEYIFSLSGLGQWGLNAILLGDFAVVQGYVLTLALFSMAIFMVIDLIVMLIEPRN